MEITPRQWLIALLLAGLLHAALAYALVQATPPVTAGPSGIRLELGAGGGSPAPRGLVGATGGDTLNDALHPIAPARPSGPRPALEPLSARTPAAAQVDSLATIEPALSSQMPTEQLLAKAVPVPAQAPRSEPPPNPAPETARESSPTPRAETPASQQPRRQRPKPESEAPRSPSHQDRPAQERVQARTESAPEQTHPSTPAPTSTPEAAHQRATPAREQQGAGNTRMVSEHAGNGGRPDGRDDGRGKGGSGQRDSGGDSNRRGKADARNYYGRLATWLARHKRYPAQARRLGQEGTVKVTFTVSRSGRVLAQRITQSSGHSLLDREAQAMLERASPLPRIPANLDRDSLTISLPVAFALR